MAINPVEPHIIQRYLGGTAELIVDRSPGYSGSFVYALDLVTPAGHLPCILKLIPDDSDDEEVTNRVYESRAASFQAAYDLLKRAAIPLPQLYAALVPQPERPFYCYVMARLPGDDVQTIRARLAGPLQTHLDALVGHHLGAIHRVTRSYDGWADWPPLHDSFWTAYQQQSTLDSTYPQFRPLFQLYVLLDWLGNIPGTQPDNVEKLTHQIVLRCLTEW